MATHRGGAGATLTHPGGNDRRKNPFLRPLCPAPSPPSPLLPPTDCGHQAHLPITMANPQAGENSWIRQSLKASRGLLTTCHPKSPQENPPAAQQETALVPSTWVNKPHSHSLPGPGQQPPRTGPSPGLHISKTWATPGTIKPQRGKVGGGEGTVSRILKSSPGVLMPSQSREPAC